MSLHPSGDRRRRDMSFRPSGDRRWSISGSSVAGDFRQGDVLVSRRLSRNDVLADGFMAIVIWVNSMDHHPLLEVALARDRLWLRRMRGVSFHYTTREGPVFLPDQPFHQVPLGQGGCASQTCCGWGPRVC